MLLRHPHPVNNLAEAQANRANICDRRGFCGPFLNRHVYASFPERLWRGMADCIHCGGTVHMRTELEKRRASVVAVA